MPGQRRLQSRRPMDQRIQSHHRLPVHRWLTAAALAVLLILLPVRGALADRVAAPGVASPLVEDAPAPAGETGQPPGDRLQVFHFVQRLNSHLQEWGVPSTGRETYDRLLLLVPARTLIAYRDGRPVRAYPAAVGRGTDPTPTGSFKIINRVEDPTWYPRGAEPVPPGPDNPIGSRWLGLDLPGYGIHGTNNPDSIGLPVSLGCIRLLPGHVEELFDRTPMGTPVDIVYQRLWVQPSPDGEEVLVGVFPDPYQRQEVAVADVFARLMVYRPAGLPSGEVSSWLSAAAGGPALFVAGPQRPAVTTLNGRPLPGVEPVMVDTEPWLPVAPLAAYVGARVQWLSPSGELWVEGLPLPSRLVAGRRLAPARLLAARLGLPMTALVDAQEALLVELSGLSVYWAGDQPHGLFGRPSRNSRHHNRQPVPTLITRRAKHLAGGRLAVPATDLYPWLGSDLEIVPAQPIPGIDGAHSDDDAQDPAAAPGLDRGRDSDQSRLRSPVQVLYRGRPMAWVTGPASSPGPQSVYVLLDSLAAAGAFTVAPHPFSPMVILQGPGRP